MKRVPVTSSTVASVGYDASTLTLEVEFKKGGVYQYFDVPQTVHVALVAAESVGAYLDANIKKAGYRYKRLIAKESVGAV